MEDVIIFNDGTMSPRRHGRKHQSLDRLITKPNRQNFHTIIEKVFIRYKPFHRSCIHIIRFVNVS